MNDTNEYPIGDIIPREEWLEAVSWHNFIDYDGFGDQLDINKKKLGHKIFPSTAKEDMLPETKYILWYNR